MAIEVIRSAILQGGIQRISLFSSVSAFLIDAPSLYLGARLRLVCPMEVDGRRALQVDPRANGLAARRLENRIPFRIRKRDVHLNHGRQRGH